MNAYEIVDAEKANFPIKLLCEAVGKSRSGYYRYQRGLVSRRKREDLVLAQQIKAVHKASKSRYGSPKIHAVLRDNGTCTSRKRVARIMRENSLASRVKRKFRRTTNSQHKHPVAPNLLERKFTAHAPNRIWVGDITYVWTVEGWLYVAVLIDLFSRKVVGWASAKTLSRTLTMCALENAIQSRRPKPGLIHHTDRGSQYASKDYQRMIKQHGMRPSMSNKGDCFDNAVAESFFATLKKELIYGHVYFTRRQAEGNIADYIDNFYNITRVHSAIDMKSPMAYELNALTQHRRGLLNFAVH